MCYIVSFEARCECESFDMANQLIDLERSWEVSAHWPSKEEILGEVSAHWPSKEAVMNGEDQMFPGRRF